MNRYKITAKDGRKFQYEAEAPKPDQPEWGQDYILEVEDITAEKAQKEQAKADRRALIQGMGAANSVAALRAVVQAMAEELGFRVS